MVPVVVLTTMRLPFEPGRKGADQTAYASAGPMRGDVLDRSVLMKLWLESPSGQPTLMTLVSW